MSNTEPTDKQINCISAINQFIKERNYSPTHKDLAAMLGVSTGSISQHIEYLVKKQLINRTTNIGRSITITNEGLKYISKSFNKIKKESK